MIDRPVREAGPGEVRVAVRAAAVNPTDLALRQYGDRNVPPPWTPGWDAAGTIEAIGDGVHRFALGDEVMAVVTPRRPEGGAQAELIVAPAASAVPIPAGATLEQAATLPMNGLTARRGLEMLALVPGQTLVVTGAAGLLGSYVIPLAKLDGLHVIADAKPEDEELVHSFGADAIVPRGERFVAAVRDLLPDGADAVYDSALLERSAMPAITDGGGLAVVRGWPGGETERGIEVHDVRVREVRERTDWLQELRELASRGRLQLRVAGEYPPEEAGEAQEVMAAGGLRGRVVIAFL